MCGTVPRADRSGAADRRGRAAQAQCPAGKGKPDAIDAHLAVLAALRLDASRLPAPRGDGERGDGDREALRILLGARRDLTVAATAQTNRLRALLICGGDTDGDLA